MSKKLVSTLLAVLLVLTMVVPAFAANPTITAPDNGHTYEVYQIFKGTIGTDESGKTTLNSIVWGANGTGTEDEPIDNETLTALMAANSLTTDVEILAVITQYANLTNPVATISNEVKAVEPGYYLIMDKAGTVVPPEDGEEGIEPEDMFYTTYIVKVVESFEIEPKGAVPTVTKTVDDVKVNEAGIGKPVEYVLTGTLPSNLASYETYYYQFNDKMSKGLTYTADSLIVTIDEVDVTKYFNVSIGTYSETTGTAITVTIDDLLSLNEVLDDDDAPIVAIDADTEVIVTYYATVNENAVIAGAGNPNEVTLKFSNDSNHSGKGTTNPTGETPKDEVVTYVTELTILKTDAAGEPLTGAEFTLTGDATKVIVTTNETYTEDKDGTFWKLNDGTYTTDDPATEGMDQTKYASTTVKYTKTAATRVVLPATGSTEIKGTVGADGKVTFTGLGAGEYTLTESVTPAGYNPIEPIEFEVTFDTDTKKFDAEDPIEVESDNTLYTEIVNESGTVLPTTGGIGTTIFYIAGAVLLVGAAVLLLTKKRMGAND